ncbi:AAA family ATPase [Streptomyces sp. NPDC057430]|uniref:AAA family ATPase n=1 Tax=Streptomyces sp. NPDC057430 TaxID=3346131 RepID=UPI0036ABF9BB
MVRALVVGVGDFPEPYASEEEQADGAAVFAPLSATQEAARALASALDRTGAVTGGDPLLECNQHEFMARWKELRQHAGPSEPLIVHFAGHGIQPKDGGSLYLATAGGEARDDLLFDTCVNFGSLLDAAESSNRPVLFLLDVCEAGQAIVQQQLIDLAGRRRQDAVRNVWIVGACTSDSITYGARFTTATAQVVHQLVDGDLDITPTLEYVPVETLASAIDRELARADHAAGRPGQSVVRTPHIQAVPAPQPFFRNPAHTKDPQTGLLSSMNPWLREFALGCAPGLDPLHFVTRAAGNPTVNTIQFSGRVSQLQRIQDWLNNTSGIQDRLLVVTGDPGSGKSALLGVTVCLTHPELEPLGYLVAPAVEHFEPRTPRIVLAVHARQLTLQQITDSLRHQLHGLAAAQSPSAGREVSPETGDDRTGTQAFLQEVQNTDDVLVVLDALDEATDPTAVLNELLLPLVGGNSGVPPSQCRVMIGTRPWWDTLPALKRYLNSHPSATLSLDPKTVEERDVLAHDLATYLRKLLPRRRYPRAEVQRIASQLAASSDNGAFLVAALYANRLLTNSEPITGDPPCTITEVFDLQTKALSRTDPWILPLLTVLGQARGQGMPLSLIHAAALAHHPPTARQSTPQLSDTRRALAKAAFYLRTTVDTDQQLLYRYFHQALTDHTKPQANPASVYTALIGTISNDGTPNWAPAHPYLLRHAADHASAAGNGALDQLLDDPRFLVHADSDALAPNLHDTAAERAVLLAHIYRTTTTHHPLRKKPAARRDLLALDAASWQQSGLAQAIAGVPLDGQPARVTPLWATRQAHPARRHTLTGHAGQVNAVASVVLPDSTPLAVTTSNDRTAIVWNLTTGRQVHHLTGHKGWVNAVATVLLPDGTPLAVTTSNDRTAIVWNLTTGRQVHHLTGHNGHVNAVATMVRPDGTPLAITTSNGRGAIVWDLATGTQLHVLGAGRVWDVATATLTDGTPLAITINDDHIPIIWNLVNGEQLHVLRDDWDWGSRVATATGHEGTTLALIIASETATVWNMATGQQLYSLTGHIDEVNDVGALVQSDGTPIAITISDDQSAIVWNLTNGQQIHRLTGHNGWVNAVTTTVQPDGTPIAVTTSNDDTTIVWDLTTDTRLHTLTGHNDWVRAVATVELPDGTPIAVTTSNDETAIVWNLTTGTRLHTLTGHNGPVRHIAIIADHEGAPIAVTTSNDRTAIVWNLITGTQLHRLMGHDGWVNEVATILLPDGTPIAVTTSNDETAIVWNLTNGQQLHRLAGHKGEVNAVATMVLPDGTPIAITTSDHQVSIVWNLTNGRLIHGLIGHRGKVNSVATVELPDGTPIAVTTSNDETAIVWNLTTGTRLHTLTGHNSLVRRIAIIADHEGGPIAVTTSNDRTAIVWNLTTGTQLRRLTGHTQDVHAVTVATWPCRTPIAVTISNDQTAIVWNLTTGEEVHCLHLPHRARVVAATETGFVIAYGQEVSCFIYGR